MRTSRRTGPIPFAKWLTSTNTVQRTHAETALYYLGPDAGNALFAAIQDESKFIPQRNALARLAGELFLLSVFFGLLTIIWQAHLAPFWVGATVLAFFQAAWRVSVSLLGRRHRVRTLALAMAKRNDPRSIGPMIEVWRPVSFLQTPIADTEIEHELTRLIPSFMAQNNISLRPDKLDVVRGKTLRLLHALEISDAEAFTGQRADLLVTLIQMLAFAPNGRDHSLLQRAADLTGDSPNESFIRDAARTILDGPWNAPAALPPPPPPSSNAPLSRPSTTATPSVVLKRQRP